jgi:photosystem II stability/assembly factor-like uncharacterized protein
LWSNNSITVAVGYDGKLATSTNGVSWTQRTSSFGTSIINAVTATSTGNRFIAVGEAGKVAFSTNGTAWTQVFPTSSFGASSIRSISVSQDGTYLAGGATGKLATSFDGNSWIQRVSAFGTSNINGVFMDNDTALAVGAAGKISYSI